MKDSGLQRQNPISERRKDRSSKTDVSWQSALAVIVSLTLSAALLLLTFGAVVINQCQRGGIKRFGLSAGSPAMYQKPTIIS